MFKFYKKQYFRVNFLSLESLRRPLENCQATPDGVATHRLGTAGLVHLHFPSYGDSKRIFSGRR